MNVLLKIDSSTINELKSIIKETVENVLKDALQDKGLAKGDSNTNNGLLTRKEVMEMLNVSHSTLYHYQLNGTIPYKKIGNRVYFKKEDIIDNPELDGQPFG